MAHFFDLKMDETNPCHLRPRYYCRMGMQGIYTGQKNRTLCIYKGLPPSHSEYRVFIDADKNDVIELDPFTGIRLTMKKRFGHESDKDPHHIRFTIIWLSIWPYENIPMVKRFAENKDSVVPTYKSMLPRSLI